MVVRGIHLVAGETRVLLIAVQATWGVEIPIGHPFICYLVECAAVLWNRFDVQADGKTVYERNKGKRAASLGIGIGEAVLWRRKKNGGALGKFTSLWEDCMYVGVMDKQVS